MGLEDVFKKKVEEKEETKPEMPVVARDKPEELKPKSLHAAILEEYGGLESNIPVNHQYWQIRP